jgi:cytochrome b561
MDYDGAAKTLHWVVVCLLVLQVPLGWTMPRVAAGQPPGSLVRFHLTIGLTILGAMLLRLVWRWRHPPPPYPDDLPAWQRRAAGAVHGLLYAVLIAAPAAGWAAASLRGWPIVLFAVWSLPRLDAAGSRLAPFAAAAHKYLVLTLLALIGVHLLAALYHVAIRRDEIVRRMLPR